MLFISSCTPMDLKIQQAIYKTQTAEETIVQTSTLTPANVNTPFPTPTMKSTPIPIFMYTFEVGHCPLGADKNSNPKKEGCMVGDSQQVKQMQNQVFDGIAVQIEGQVPYLIDYCALYGNNGELIDFQLDIDQTGSLFCKPN